MLAATILNAPLAASLAATISNAAFDWQVMSDHDNKDTRALQSRIIKSNYLYYDKFD